MANGGAGRPELTAYSRRIVANIERLRDQAAVTNAQIIAGTRMSKNYFYMRLRHEAPFTTEDLSAIAGVLGIDPGLLTDLSEVPQNPRERFDGAQLAERLLGLVEAQRSDFSLDSLTAYLQTLDIPFSRAVWAALVAGKSEVRVSEDVLAGIAGFFEVDPLYLLKARIDNEVERVNAEVEVTLALREAGATSISGRALGSLSPDVLHSVAKAIRDATAKPR